MEKKCEVLVNIFSLNLALFFVVTKHTHHTKRKKKTSKILIATIEVEERISLNCETPYSTKLNRERVERRRIIAYKNSPKKKYSTPSTNRDKE